jgi:hypothetical protein
LNKKFEERIKHLITAAQQILLRWKYTITYMSMMIVGQVSSKEEAKQIEAITKNFVVGNRARLLALQKKN